MPVHIPDSPTRFSSTDATVTTTTTTITDHDLESPSYVSSNAINSHVQPSELFPLIEEKFIPPTSAQGIWIRIKGYTNHLSPVGKRYAREQFNLERVGFQADEYRETLIKETTRSPHSPSSSSGGEGVDVVPTGLILKVEALKRGKILAVVNTRLTKEEEEVYCTFVRERNVERRDLLGPREDRTSGPVIPSSSPSLASVTNIDDENARTTRQPSAARLRSSRDDHSPQDAATDGWNLLHDSRPGVPPSNWRQYDNVGEEAEAREEDALEMPQLVEADRRTAMNISTSESERVEEEEMTAEDDGIEARVMRIASTRELIEESRTRAWSNSDTSRQSVGR